MQTLFRNPLAGPDVLGLSSGASLGVATIVMGATFLPMGGNPNQVTNYVATFTNYYFQAEGPITNLETNDKVISYTVSPGVVSGQPLQYVTASGGGLPTDMVLQIIDGINPPNNIPTTYPGVLKFETDALAPSANNLSDDWSMVCCPFVSGYRYKGNIGAPFPTLDAITPNSVILFVIWISFHI